MNKKPYFSFVVYETIQSNKERKKERKKQTNEQSVKFQRVRIEYMK
jgi:hypothetical protein